MTRVAALFWSDGQPALTGKESGSLGWTRTNDQRINSPTLYRLSYQGTENQ